MLPSIGRALQAIKTIELHIALALARAIHLSEFSFPIKSLLQRTIKQVARFGGIFAVLDDLIRFMNESTAICARMGKKNCCF